jgi:hypothetical protein
MTNIQSRTQDGDWLLAIGHWILLKRQTNPYPKPKGEAIVVHPVPIRKMWKSTTGARCVPVLIPPYIIPGAYKYIKHDHFGHYPLFPE